jgi:Kef-type K+ transport system membrane component KefB
MHDGMSPTVLLFAQIAVILGVSRALSLLAVPLRQPAVIAEIIAGILLGPTLLGALAPGVYDALFSQARLGGLSALSQVGLTLFLFVVGLEFNPGLIAGRGRQTAVITLCSILVPACFGLGLAPVLHSRFAPDIDLLALSLFMGASMAVTAFPVLARILAEQGLGRTPVGSQALVAAAFNDLAAWCLLAVVIGVITAGSPASALGTVLMAGVFLVGMVFGLRPVLRRLALRFGTDRGPSTRVVAVIMVGLLLSSLATELIGVHALVGAFAFGLAVPRENRTAEHLIERIEELTGVLLLPIFFALSGLRTELGLLSDPQGLLWTGIIVAVATAGKLLGTALPARWTGLGWRDSALLGVLMNTRGLVELIILNIGLDLGVLSPPLFTMLVVMAVATTLMTSPLLSLIYPKAARFSAQPEAAAVPTGAVLTCVAAPESARPLARITALFAVDRPAWALRLIPVQNIENFQVDVVEDTEEMMEDAAHLLTRHAAELGVPVRPITWPSNDPGGDIAAVAQLKKADLLLLGLHRPLVGTAQLGGPLLTIAQRCRTDLAILSPRGLGEVRKVLYARGGEHAAAVERVVERLRRHRKLQLIEHQGPPGDLKALMEAAAEVDLVVVSVGRLWGLAMASFEVRGHELINACPTSLLMVHGPSEGERGV